jgi:predicted glycoside hydrolase/deacetylase ChbG (UPF0249 family)
VPPADNKGVLIVNADDLGGFVGATDAIARCFDAGAISSSTMMVGMNDSPRAGEMAKAKHWPVGLHLNLTQPFDEGAVPRADRERQGRLVKYFENLRLRRRLPEVRPHIRRMVRDEIAFQLEQFEELVGSPPRHIDSHNHSHTCGVVLASLPSNFPVRRTASKRGQLIAARFISTDRFMSFPDASRAAYAAKTESVELMVHPSFENELPVLLSDSWHRQINEAQLGSFSDLEARPTKMHSALSALAIEPAAALLTDWRI